MRSFVGWAKAPARNVDVTKALAWRRAHASIECVRAGLTRGHGARALDRDCGSVWAGAPLPTLQRIYSLALALLLLPAPALAGVKEKVAALAPLGLVLVMDAEGNELVAQNTDEPFVPASV